MPPTCPAGPTRQTLTAGQKAILNRKLALKSSDRSLSELLKAQDIAARVPDALGTPLLISTPGLSVNSLLRAVTKPAGLDFYMEGDTVVVAPAEHVRRLVGQK